ncbi:MAG: VCBS repeat-containing protein, partial [Planctomycetaceae bacterium]|nr:VCBS repeat-containing protein [Planctomycetaceae bacterium]
GSNDVWLLPGVGGGFFNDQDPTIFPVGRNPGPLFVGNFMGRPGQLDLVTVNAGSNDLTLIPDFLHGGQAQEIPSGGTDPVAALAGDFLGDGRTDLLVANNGDGRLALFLGGSDGLEPSINFENPDLPNPTALAMDDLGRIFGVSEGDEAAVLITLGLGPGEQQVPQLQPLSPASLAVVATLLSTTVEMTSNEIAIPAEAETAETSLATAEPTGGATAGPGAIGGAALPNQSPLQSLPPKNSPDTDPDAKADPIWADISGTAVVTQVSQNPVARFLSGLDEAFSRARLKARQGSLFAPSAPAGATGPKLRALDALLARWSPVVTTLGGPVPKMALQFGRAGVAVARAVDAALQSLGSDRERPGAANGNDRLSCEGPVPVGRSAHILGMASIGLAAVAWPVADLVRPPAPRRHRRFARPGRDERGAARFELRQ